MRCSARAAARTGTCAAWLRARGGLLLAALKGPTLRIGLRPGLTCGRELLLEVEATAQLSHAVVPLGPDDGLFAGAEVVVPGLSAQDAGDVADADRFGRLQLAADAGPVVDLLSGAATEGIAASWPRRTDLRRSGSVWSQPSSLLVKGECSSLLHLWRDGAGRACS